MTVRCSLGFALLLLLAGCVHLHPGAPDREDEEAEAAADKVLSSSAIYDESLDAIEDRVEELRGTD